MADPVNPLKDAALDYHRRDRPGKLAVVPTKPVAGQGDLSLAYTPGVGEPVRAIAARPDDAYLYTARANLVAVVTNGTAVLGLGDVGPLAAKPVMEGKAVLFKRFADVDAFDLELDARDPDQVVTVIKALQPTFGGITLEDIKAPECFVIERRLQEELDIPVFHDDQHGTAVTVAAAFLNGLRLTDKAISQVRVVINGAGAAAIATAHFLRYLGVQRENLLLCDSRGVVYAGRREGMNPYKEPFAVETDCRTLADALEGADAFIGLSVGGVVNADMVRPMAPRPLVFALANPDPEIGYHEARAARPDAIVATGRSDFPNQINNVLGFPSIFRGALDVRARAINDAMKAAAARALADLTWEPVPPEVARAHGVERLEAGPEYIIPKVFDPRVVEWVAPAVAEAAMASGVARVSIDLEDYRRRLARRMEALRERLA